MSHSDKKEPDLEDQDREENLEEKAGSEGAEPEVKDELAPEDPSETNPLDSELANDARFSRLMKMQSQFVTEEALRSTEEASKPKEAAPPAEDEFEEEELYEDEEFEEEEFEDDFEDDDYEDDSRPQGSAPASTPPPKEQAADPADSESEEEDPTDHRVAQLRKLNKTFVKKSDLEVKKGAGDAVVYKDTVVQVVVCPNCQSEEPRTQKICSQCGAKLPNITAVEEEKYNPGTLNVAVLKYYDAVKKLRAESWSVDEFVDFLHERQELSQAHVDGIHEVIDECGSEEWMPDATKLIRDAMDLLEVAIERMIVKVNDAVAEHVEVEEDNPDAPTLEEKILEIDFTPDLEDIKKSNGMMLDTLKKIDEFQKQAQADLEVSL